MAARGRQALGKGLGALIAPPRFSNLNDDYFMCPIAEVQPDPEQPRQRFEDASLEELVASIKEKGILQPLIVRREEQGYIVVAGERRLRAAEKAGLTEVPVLVKDVATEEAFELALIENIQREDLNPIEEAAAYARLLERDGYTQDLVAHRVGKDRSTVANALRLLRLEADLQQLVIDGSLTAGHARCVLSVPDDAQRAVLAERIVKEGLSVRQAEQAARKLKEEAAGDKDGDGSSTKRRRRTPPLKPYFDTVAQELTERLGVDVSVQSRGRKGRIVIDFTSVEELRTLREALLQDAAPPS